MNNLDDQLHRLLSLGLDETDREPPPEKPPAVSDHDLIARLHDAASAIAASSDAPPPVRLRHLATIDLAIARLRRDDEALRQDVIDMEKREC